MRYKFIDHTADIAFEVYGSNMAELLENSALAFYEAFVQTEKIDNSIEKKIEVEGEDEELLLYHWLNELLYLFDTEFFAAKDVEVEVSGFKATGVLKGGRFTPEIVKVEPKAITMHRFKVEKGEEGYRAFVVVDI